jgi:hypothetical protein
MIITRLLGGLGNQMFQYAAGLALAERRRTVLKLDVSWYRHHPEYEAHNRYALSCFNVTEQFATAEELEAARPAQLTRTERWGVAVARALRLRGHVRRQTRPDRVHAPPTFAYYPDFGGLPDGTCLEGMFQSERFFTDVADLLRLHFSFRYPAPPEVAALADRIRAKPSAALHFRRGDYARDPSFARELGVVGVDYYQAAEKLIRERSPDAVLYIFSDDIERVAQEYHPSGPHEFVRCVQSWHAHDTLRLMSLCEHIAIANSTFSWWAAWLNPSPTKLVIAPSPWFANSPLDTRDVVPAGWLRLPART